MGREQEVGDGVLDEVGVSAVLTLHGALHNASLDEKGVQLLKQALASLSKGIVNLRLDVWQRFVSELG